MFVDEKHRSKLTKRVFLNLLVAEQIFEPSKPGGPWLFMLHTMACVQSNVIFWMEPVLPKQYSEKYTHVQREFEDTKFPMSQRTCALMLRATKSIWNSHRLVVHDAKFSGVAVMALLSKKKLYGITPLKPRDTYYARATHAAELKEACESLAIGEFASRKGTYILPALDDINASPMPITMFEFALQMPKHTLMLLATAGDLRRSLRTKVTYVSQVS